ncbi:C-1-tetrahydrofolate synthase, cytoplasmic [Galendromus occidentalis]|uniref:C-1-tetrahydrofolate synthase, cytoplasmic n=1 Tax=Galendromus occidentalis TaxID=34638 RepID=A0AAJ6QVW9_9ACAR|nr:C-1-tetrahydrofolate synthase, cytoplasmic [Galendromus occidentalis]
MAKILSGTQISKEVLSDLQQEVTEIKETHPDFRPKLVIVQVGGREDSNVYIRAKCKAAAEVGVETEHIRFPRTVAENELLRGVELLNADPRVHGIIVQLPLDCDNPIDAGKVTNAVSPLKDVDGIHTENAGRLAHGELENFFIPCTPRGCLELILRTGMDLCGKHAVMIGRSKIVGAPMSALLLSCNATVTVCHSKTERIDEICRQADLLVVACGCAHLVKKEWVRPGAVVIDCGINAIKDPSHPKGQRLVGDVDYANVKEVASWITPVPGGVGPMTVSMLIKNTVISAKRELLGTLRNNLQF